MRTSPRHMRLQRNQQRTTTNQSSSRNQKIRKTRHHHRWHRHKRNRHGTPSPKNESLLRLRRNRQKRPNHTPRRPPRTHSQLPHRSTGLSKRQHRSPINTQKQQHTTGAKGTNGNTTQLPRSSRKPKTQTSLT